MSNSLESRLEKLEIKVTPEKPVVIFVVHENDSLEVQQESKASAVARWNLERGSALQESDFEFIKICIVYKSQTKQEEGDRKTESSSHHVNLIDLGISGHEL